MNILYLKYALEIAKTGSINRAAEALYVAQPNLSRAVKELESSLGVTLFERTSKGMTPTPDGEKFLQYAANILRQVDEVEAMFRSKGGNMLGFSISVPRASYISHAFAQFTKQIPDDRRAEIYYKETNALRAIDNILHADFKLGIVRYAAQYDRYFKQTLEEKGLSCELVTEFVYVLVMNVKSPLAAMENIRFGDLAPYIEIAHADPFVPSLPLSQVRKEELPEAVDRRIFVYERASQFEILAENPQSIMWVSPIPQNLLDRYGLVQKKCSDNQKVYRDMLIYRNGYKLTALDKAFITELCNARRLFIES